MTKNVKGTNSDSDKEAVIFKQIDFIFLFCRSKGIVYRLHPCYQEIRKIWVEIDRWKNNGINW